MIVHSPHGRIAALFVMASALALTACSGEAPPPAPPPPEVSVVKVAPSPMAVADELPGRVVAFRVAEIRPQVNGVIQRRLFEQGSEVRAGQALFQINAAPFSADANSASASVQRAQAALARARLQEQRLAPLVKTDAISGQAYDDAVAARDQAAADLAMSRAELARRRVDLGFATIRSPISGRIDQAVSTEGALASTSGAQPLATVQQIDRVYVDVRQPAARLDMLREAAKAGTANQGAPVEIVSSDGKVYPVKGRLLFSGISVDPGTGEVIARVEVPNADRMLLPGMFVRARLPRLNIPNALTVPEQAVQRDPAGKASVSVVGQDGKVAPRPIQTGDTRNGVVVVTDGLKAGDTVIVEGQDRVQPGAPVKPMPWRQAGAQR